MQLWGVVLLVVVSCCNPTSTTFRVDMVLTVLFPFPCLNSFYWIYTKITATSGCFMGTTYASVQLLSLKFCQDLHKYGYLPPCQIRSASAQSDKSPVTQTEGAVSPRGSHSHRAQRYVRVFTLHTPPPLKRSPGSLNPSVPYYCHAHHSRFYIALFTTYYQKQEHCRDEQRLWAHIRNKTHDSVVFVKLKLHPAHLCSNKPGSGKLHAVCSF